MQHKPYGPYERYVKRALDILLSGLAIVVLSPLLILLAILVRVKLGSPVIYRAKRPGKNERIFEIWKFRSMTNKKDAEGKLLPDKERLTGFGRMIRAASLDELPELFNIIRGDMSIVGPRPLAVSYLEYYTEQEKRRHCVRPGLTGLAQVNGRNALSWEDKFAYDLKYVDHITFAEDFSIIMKTVQKVFKREGIGQGERAPVSLSVERRKAK